MRRTDLSRLIPALFTSTSMRSCRRRTSSTTRWQSCALPMLPRWTDAFSGCGQALFVLIERQRAGDTPDVAAAFGPVRRTQRVVRHHVADPDATTRPKHAVHLREDPWLVGRQIDDAVRDDHIDRAARERHV